ncbi:alpha-2-macroglobulin family protein [Vulcanimicrobium alpinum]|uniref:alpha-2-macroglobulin family protein n=1 Tax=Vulcanimicrobium alpinum TaxID=3016050 RepID=UPI00295EFBA4|nr:Ig-like domain-containing protein [Vulcanimicrobium alpinum]
MNTRHASVLALAAGVLLAAGCARRGPEPAPLAAVSPLPVPSKPPLIAAAQPVGEVDVTAQIRVRFGDDLIPLEQLESPGERAILAHFTIDPPLAGAFRFLTPRMIGFEPDRAWPAATRIRVTIAKGLRTVHGRSLDEDVAWTFQTPAVELSDLPADNASPYTLAPRLHLTSNVALDRASLQAHAVAHPASGSGPDIPLVIPPDTATAAPSATSPSAGAPDEYDPSSQTWRYRLVPSAPLAKGTKYDVVFSSGIAPRDGNVPSATTFTGHLTTYGTLRFQSVQWERPGRFAAGSPLLAFSNPIDPKSISELRLRPAPPAGLTPFAIAGGRVAVNASLLRPATDYTVAIGAGITDTFGQPLDAAQTATFRTGDLAPDVWAPGGVSLFPASKDVRLNVVAVNAPPVVRAAFRALTPPDVVQHPDPYGDPGRDDMLSSSDSWPAFDARAPKNVQRTFDVPLTRKLGAPGGALAYGVTAEFAHSTYLTEGVVQLTDLGVFAQYFPDGGIVRVHRIADGTPVAGAQVAVYPSQAGNETKTAPAACATATTNAAGAATFARGGFAACAARDQGKNDAPSFVTIVRRGGDWTYVRTDASSGAYAGDFWNGWSSATPIARGTIFSDRQLYQPGETAQMTAEGWFLVDGELRRGTAPLYTLTLEAPDGSKTDLGRRSLDAFGVMAFPVALAAHATLGYYSVHATAGNGEQLDGSFRVAEFKPPNFKVDLALDRDVVQRGATVAAAATSTYLFGAPVSGASTKFTVTRAPAPFVPKGRDGFVFGRRWFWPEQQPDAATDVLQSTLAVDAQGKNAVSVPVSGELPYAMTYRVDADTTDASNVDVADSKTFTALPSATLVGIKSDDVGIAGTPLHVGVIASDPGGASISATAVHLELQAADYSSATQIVEGAERSVDAVTYRTVAAADVTTAAAPVDAALTPPKAGTYRLRATVAGNNGEATETDWEIFVAGEGADAWYARDPSVASVKLDKDTYKPGDTVTALVQSPFPSAELHVAVVRHGVLWETTQVTASRVPAVKFTVTSEMLPNVAVEALLVRRGPVPSHVSPAGGNALARVGFASFNVALDAKYLRATVRAGNSVTAPGAAQTVRVHLTDAANRPVAGEATVMVVNDAVLQLTGYRPPDLVKQIYADQPISTRYADNRGALVLATLQRPLQKGWGFGGGLSGEDADPRVRRKFSPLAFFAGALRTDANGDASATFTLPDDLTTWRMIAVTASADGRFGNADATFRTTLPLIANPVLPQFARPGTGDRGDLRIDARFAGPLAFLIGGKAVPATTLQTPLEAITRAYRFSIVATGTGDATVTVNVRGAHAADAFAIPLPVRDADVAEAVAQTGTTLDHASVGLNVASGTPRDSGGLDIVLASSLLPEIDTAAQRALLGDDRLALSSASRLAIAADLVTLAARSGGDATLARRRAAAELTTLASLRRRDGGFAPYWQAEKSDAWDSIGVLSALASARAAKLPVDGALIGGASAYVAAVLNDPPAHVAWCTNASCKAQLRLAALIALADAGDRRSTFLGQIDAEAAHFDFADRARLARVMTGDPGYADRAAALAKAIDDLLTATARGAAVTLPARYAWRDSRVVAQAEALRLELARGADGETINRVTRALLDMRRNGSFGCACENAAALAALVDVSARESRADFTAAAAIGGRTVATERFSGARAAQRSTTVAMRDLPRGRSDVTLTKQGSGTMHYGVTYRYRLAGAAPGRLNGLRVTRIVHPANSATVLASFGLAIPSSPLELAAAQVYDIELQVISDHPVERVLISDPLPAGMQAVDTGFATASTAVQAPQSAWEIGDQQIRSDRIEAYADRLDPGIYRLHYLVRTVTPGTYAWPGADAHLADRPDEFGRSAVSTLTVRTK